jgi:hypothetical protein
LLQLLNLNLKRGAIHIAKDRMVWIERAHIKTFLWQVIALLLIGQDAWWKSNGLVLFSAAAGDANHFIDQLEHPWRGRTTAFQSIV